MNSTSAALAALLVGLSLSCRSSAPQGTTYAEIGDLVAHGDFKLAVELAAEKVRKAPGDEQAREVHRRASVAYLLEQGRRATFEDRDEEALAFFGRACEVDPEAEQAQAWYSKTRKKIGLHWFLRARDLHLDEQLDAALEAYEKSLAMDPDQELAQEGLARLLIVMNYRLGLGEDYYIEGVRALNEYWLQVARSRFQYSSKYTGDGSRAGRRVTEVDRMLSQQRMAVGRALEGDGLFHAARNEYYLAHVLDPKNVDAELARERMQIEAEATRKADAAEMMILRGEYDRAREKIEEGLAITREQEQVFLDKLADIDDARAQVKYEYALDLEHDYRYEKAIEAYEELLDEREWFEDARSRLTTLQEYVVHAADLYQRAQSAASVEERVGLLRQIESFWPEYRDTHELLETLDPDGD